MQQQEHGMFRNDSWVSQAAPPSTGQRMFQLPNTGIERYISSPQGHKMDPAASAPFPFPPSPAQHRANLAGSANSAKAASNPTDLGTFRQVSLDVINNTGIQRVESIPTRQTLFNDVLEQLSSKEDSSADHLYTLPSERFLERLLEEMDKRTVSMGRSPAEPPIYLPIESFDLAETVPRAGKPAATTFASLMAAEKAHTQRTELRPPAITIHASALAHKPMAPPAPLGGFIPLAPTAGSAAPSPQRGVHMRAAATAVHHRAVMAEELYEFDEAEVSMQTSKSGRMRKVTMFAGAKRKLEASDAMTHGSAPAALAGGAPSAITNAHCNAISESGAASADADDSGDEVSKRSRRTGTSRGKGRRSVCLNCGSQQTPQWRCGPLGPRTLCNACGVRFKKGLPMNCWPIREGMVLPPGAQLPPSVYVPPGVTVITQPSAAME